MALQRLPKTRGRGTSGWILPSPTLEWVLPATPGRCSRGLRERELRRAGTLVPRSALVQSRLDRLANLINNGKSQWLAVAAALLGERSLRCFGASSPLPGRCPQASCPIFRPGGRGGVRAAVAEGGLRPAALSPSPGLLACCSKQLLGGSVAGCERGRPGWKWCSRPGVAGQMPITSLL